MQCMSAWVEPLWSGGSFLDQISIHTAAVPRSLIPCKGLSLSIAGLHGCHLCKEFEGETGPSYPVTDAIGLAVAGFAAFNPIGSEQAIFANAVLVPVVVLIFVELAEQSWSTLHAVHS